MGKKFFILITAVTFLAGCTLGPDYERPPQDLSNQWRPDLPVQVSGAVVPITWWRLFDDHELNQLQEEALLYNRDLRVAIAKVDEYRAKAGIARADLLPTLNLGGQGGKQQYSQETGAVYPDRITEYYHLQGLLSYELDIWGKYRRLSEAARAELLSAQTTRDTVQLSITSEVAKGYFTLTALDAQLEIAYNTLDSRNQWLELQQARFNRGYSTELEYRRAEAEVFEIRGTIHDLESSVAQAENALAVLVGRSPRDIVQQKPLRGKKLEMITVPPEIPPDLPSTLLTRRPDIKSAEGTLVAANARIGAARAGYFPSITITGAAGWESSSLSSLFIGSAGIWNFFGQFLTPIFDGGRVMYQVEQAEALQQQALAQYESTIHKAFQEVLDALISNRKLRESMVWRKARVGALQRSLTVVKLQYGNGYVGYLDVLDAERNLYQAQIDLAGSQRDQLNAIVDVCRALGGGWDEENGFMEKAENQTTNKEETAQ